MHPQIEGYFHIYLYLYIIIRCSTKGKHTSTVSSPSSSFLPPHRALGPRPQGSGVLGLWPGEPAGVGAPAGLDTSSSRPSRRPCTPFLPRPGLSFGRWWQRCSSLSCSVLPGAHAVCKPALCQDPPAWGHSAPDRVVSTSASPDRVLSCPGKEQAEGGRGGCLSNAPPGRGWTGTPP